MALLAVASVGGLAVAVRYEMTRRVTAEYERRVASLVAVIRADLARERHTIDTRLAGLSAAIKDDNTFRLAITGAITNHQYVIDYARRVMPPAGLSMLTIEDVTFRVVSSGHFRNEFDRVDSVARLVVEATSRGDTSVILMMARTAEGPFIALARADAVSLGSTSLALVGGVRFDRDYLKRLARGEGLVITLAYPGGGGSLSSADSAATPTPGAVLGDITLPFVATEPAPHLASARLVVTQSLAPLIALQESVTRWSLLAGAVATVLALFFAAWLASRLSRPIADLAGQTATLDLERLDVDFSSDRTDEVGTLTRTLGALADRLRKGARQLREAERRATVGDLARQVNHDIKNGLVPIRNVLRHLNEVLESRPAELPQVLRERKATLDAGVEYLETLAANYARLTPKLDAGGCDVAAVVAEVIAAARPGARIDRNVAANLPAARGDRVVLRRILENLVGNALDSVAETGGLVTVTAEPVSAGVLIAVQDTGPGMTPAQLEKAFEDFYTTKPGGTGLGLSVVRRLVGDLAGSLKVTTEPGAGTRVEITLPTALPPYRLTAPPTGYA
jgi:signal transduction histidine kinase